MIKYTKHNLSKLEEIFREMGITVRYEKGNFQSGYCIVSGKNIVIINRFFEIEARMNTLLDIMDSGNFDLSGLSEENTDWLNKLKKALQPSV